MRKMAVNDKVEELWRESSDRGPHPEYEIIKRGDTINTPLGPGKVVGFNPDGSVHLQIEVKIARQVHAYINQSTPKDELQR